MRSLFSARTWIWRTRSSETPSSLATSARVWAPGDVDSETHLDHVAFALTQAFQRFGQAVLERDVFEVGAVRTVVVDLLQEIAQAPAFLVVVERLVEGAAGARRGDGGGDQVFPQVRLRGDLGDARLRISEPVSGVVDVLHRLLQVHRYAHRVGEVVQVAAEGLVEPVHRIGTEQESTAPIEAVDGAEERGRTFLDQVELARGRVRVTLDVDQHEVKVAFDHFGPQSVQLQPAAAHLPRQLAVRGEGADVSG